MSKKEFKANPLENFFTSPESEKKHSVKKREKRNMAIDVIKTPETKTKRLNLLMKPSLYEKLRSLAISKNISINELINQLCIFYTDNI